MHPVDGIAATGSITKAVALRAAEWYFLLKAGNASPQHRLQWEAWRAADPAHEQAWQRVLRLSSKLEQLPAPVALRALRRAENHRRTAVKTLAFALAAPSLWLTWRNSPARDWFADYRTATGEMRELRLADGTRIWLNTASAIDVAYDGTMRRVRLRDGEILIETAPDVVPRGHPAYRPFIVQTRQARLTALGTRFAVRQLQDGRSHVAVLEGRVEVRPDGAPEKTVVLNAGWEADFSATRIETLTATRAPVGDWTRGIFRAKDMRLADFLGELSRYRSGILRCDPDIAELPVTGVFQVHATQAILDSLPQSLPVRVVYRTPYWVTVTRGPG